MLDRTEAGIAASEAAFGGELMLALEMEFGVQISSEAMPALLSLDAIEEHLREQGVPASV